MAVFRHPEIEFTISQEPLPGAEHGKTADPSPSQS